MRLAVRRWVQSGLKRVGLILCSLPARQSFGAGRSHCLALMDGGDGKRMRNREETCRSDGAVLVCESVICNNAPDDEAAENRGFYL